MADNKTTCRKSQIGASFDSLDDVRVKTFCLSWEIRLASLDRSAHNFSPVFTTPDYEWCKWKIRLDFDSESISVYLHSVETNPEVLVHYTFFISPSRSEKYHVKQADEAVYLKPGECDGFYNYRSAQDINYAHNIKICCELFIVIKTGNCKLRQDLENLLDDKKFCDVTLVAGDHEFRAHKNILKVRSDVFAAMFEHEMEESKSGRIVITDIKPEVLKEMLRFMYTGKVPKLSEMTGDLLAAADKYALENLKVMCEKEFCSQLSPETAVKILILADRHGSGELKSKAMHFICTHADEIMDTPVWINAIAEHTHLIALQFSGFVKSKLLKMKDWATYKFASSRTIKHH